MRDAPCAICPALHSPCGDQDTRRDGDGDEARRHQNAHVAKATTGQGGPATNAGPHASATMTPMTRSCAVLASPNSPTSGTSTKAMRAQTAPTATPTTHASAALISSRRGTNVHLVVKLHPLHVVADGLAALFVPADPQMLQLDPVRWHPLSTTDHDDQKQSRPPKRSATRHQAPENCQPNQEQVVALDGTAVSRSTSPIARPAERRRVPPNAGSMSRRSSCRSRFLYYSISSGDPLVCPAPRHL